MKKTRTRITALLGALALTVWGIGITGCFTSLDSSDDSSGNRGGAYERLADGGPSGRIAPTAPASQGSITVSETQVLRTTTVALSSGGGTYTKIQDALNAAANMTNPVITLSKGTYKENGLKYNGNNNLIIKGESTAGYGTDVLIVGQGSDMSQESTRSLLSFEGSANIVIQNITLKNSYGETSGTAQAETLGVSNKAFTGTLAVYNCSFLSGQDTICTQGKAWFYKCYIEGDVDFLWMEGQKGEAKVALYEECIIRAIGTRSTSAYLAAPRALASEASVWKGVVLYNSTIQAESGLKNFYLGRNPWAGSTSHYNNVAIVGCRLQLADGVTLHDDIWKSAAHGTSNQQHIGFKTDEYFTKSAAGHGARLTAAQIAADYAGRENILNRYYDTNSTKFKKDAEAYWDVAATVSANGLDVTPDSSQSLLAGEKEVKSVVYTFSQGLSGVDVTSSTGDMSGFAWSGFTTWNNGHGAQGNGTITLTLTEPSVITLKACAYNSSGTIATTGVTKKEFKGVSDGESQSILYTGNGGTLEIAFTGTVYLHDQIIVKTLTDEVNKVTKVAIIGNTLLAPNEDITLTANVTSAYLNDMSGSTVTWSSSNTSVATVTSNGVVKGVATGSATITASCGGVSGTILVEVDGSDVVSRDTFFDLRTLFSGLSTSGSASTGSIGKLSYSAMYYKDSQHGAYFYRTSTLSFKVSGACTIYLGKNSNNGANYTVSDGSKSSDLDAKGSGVLGENVTEDMSGDAENPSFKYTGNSEATITISVTGSSATNYLPAIQVKF